MSFRKRALAGAALFEAFCFAQRFLLTGRSRYTAFMGPVDFTLNTAGYLSYLHTATFYTVLFTAHLAGSLRRPTAQALVRRTRVSLFAGNALLPPLWAAAFSALLCLPHLVFMGVYFPAGELAEIGFGRLLLLQYFAYTLYYALTGTLTLLLYSLSLSRAAGVLGTVGVNAAAMFATRHLGLRTPIEDTLIFTKVLGLGLPAGTALAEASLWAAPAGLLTAAALAVFQRRDILS